MPAPASSVQPGFIGSVVFDSIPLRAKSSSLQAKQNISMPDVVDGSVDRTLYQLGAIECGGGLVIPVVQESNSGSFLATVWDYAVQRSTTTGQLTNINFPIILNYSYGTGRRFNGCIVNSLSMRATAGEAVEATIDVIARNVEVLPPGGPQPVQFSPARVLTWNDVQVTSSQFDTCQVKEFNFEINNNCARNYTFCPEDGLFASSINSGKRYVNGTLMFQGYSPLQVFTEVTQQANCSSDELINFSVAGCDVNFNAEFRHVVYEWQQIDINAGANQLIVSTVNWYALGGGNGEPAIART